MAPDLPPRGVMLLALLLFAAGCLDPAGQTARSPMPTATPGPLAGETADVLFFWGEDCHACHEVRPIVEELAREHPDLRFEFVEIYRNTTNATRYHTLNRALDIMPRGVPEAVADGRAFFGEDEIRSGLPGAVRAVEVRRSHTAGPGGRFRTAVS